MAHYDAPCTCSAERLRERAAEHRRIRGSEERRRQLLQEALALWRSFGVTLSWKGAPPSQRELLDLIYPIRPPEMHGHGVFTGIDAEAILRGTSIALTK
jgi:hypothetical protein